ncbi:ATP-binding protein [Paenibacillus thiaminolyticus]|uniref:AAA family ATPase n=1 Tax=Paenibacillus thiaminolyticus TaxID=49283 RepID=UPI0011626968|nr:AAA family ATPase [Paenibacillus thiaminolyticus]NGP61212.1 ATP-binding protein [Paenibacillus thiaminolyticus]WCR25228.1 ATP-binding protein [Paenibacillus thiaminolyticus]
MTECTLFRDDFVIITGGPGAGKTTLLQEMQRQGYSHVPEVAREIIQAEMSSNGDALPWGNAIKYRDIMLEKSIESYHAAQSNDPGRLLFFDRGIPDTLAYSCLIHAPVPEELESAARHYRYNKQVFILPPWEEIYQTDRERVQDFKEAQATYEIMSETYQRLEYELVVVPKLPVEERVEFVMEHAL